MTLKACMKSCGLEASLKVGLTALGKDSARVKCVGRVRPTESIALDESLKKTAGQDNRWDYGVGLAGSSQTRTAWIEIHPASSSEVGVFLKKLQWLKAWLRSHGTDACRGTASYHWVSTTGVYIDSKHRRRLNQAGIAMPKKTVWLH